MVLMLSIFYRLIGDAISLKSNGNLHFISCAHSEQLYFVTFSTTSVLPTVYKILYICYLSLFSNAISVLRYVRCIRCSCCVVRHSTAGVYFVVSAYSHSTSTSAFCGSGRDHQPGDSYARSRDGGVGEHPSHAYGCGQGDRCFA